MAVKIITGTRLENNVQSEDDGARIYGTISTGDRVLNVGEKLNYEIVSNNCVRIKSGEILMQGRHIRQTPGTYTDLTIDNGTQGQKRNDIIVLRYTKESGTDIEDAELAVRKGTSDNTAVDPDITTGDIYTGCLIHEMPLYRVSLDGLNIASVTQMFKTQSPIDNIADLVYPVGSIYMSVNSTNPSTLFGGTWESWGAGRVPVGVNTSDSNFSTVEKIGGEKSHTLTTSEMPSHNHTRGGSDAGWGAGNYGSITDVLVSLGTTSANQLYFHSAGATNSTGGGSAHNNLQPYITCYMWKRTA